MIICRPGQPLLRFVLRGEGFIRGAGEPFHLRFALRPRVEYPRGTTLPRKRIASKWDMSYICVCVYVYSSYIQQQQHHHHDNDHILSSIISYI